MILRGFLSLLLVLSLSILSACGQSGPLYFPECDLLQKQALAPEFPEIS